MVKYRVILAFIVILFSGCNLFDPDEPLNYSDRVIIKILPMGKDTVEWYHYSLISGFSPGIVELKSPSGRKLICKSSYMCDVLLQGDTLLLKTDENDFNILDTGNVEGLRIMIDTNAHVIYNRHVTDSMKP